MHKYVRLSVCSFVHPYIRLWYCIRDLVVSRIFIKFSSSQDVVQSARIS